MTERILLMIEVAILHTQPQEVSEKKLQNIKTQRPQDKMMLQT